MDYFACLHVVCCRWGVALVQVLGLLQKCIRWAGRSAPANRFVSQYQGYVSCRMDLNTVLLITETRMVRGAQSFTPSVIHKDARGISNFQAENRTTVVARTLGYRGRSAPVGGGRRSGCPPQPARSPERRLFGTVVLPKTQGPTDPRNPRVGPPRKAEGFGL